MCCHDLEKASAGDLKLGCVAVQNRSIVPVVKCINDDECGALGLEDFYQNLLKEHVQPSVRHLNDKDPKLIFTFSWLQNNRMKRVAWSKSRPLWL